MSARFGSFWKGGAAKVDGETLSRIKDWTREILALDGEATLSANEIVCADPACPGTETVILVMVPGRRTKAYKALGPMGALTREALASALAET